MREEDRPPQKDLLNKTTTNWFFTLVEPATRAEGKARKGGGKGGRAEAGAGQAAVEAKGGGGKGGEQAEPKVKEPRADPFNPAG